MAAVFITNAMLTQWTDQGKVRLDDTTLTLLQEHRTVKLTPAVRFIKTIDGGDDPNKLLGKVKTADQLAEMSAEHYLDSVILGDTGYQVVEGFMGDLSPPPKGAAAPAAPPRTGTPAAVSAGVGPVAVTSPNVPAPISTPPMPAPPATQADEEPPKSDLEKEAEALSALFLSTVRD